MKNNTPLTRLGNKAAIAKKILPYFPDHSIYIELFFGAGGMFFNKPKAQYNILNDLDSDVYNLWVVIQERKQELIDFIYSLPYHIELFDYWKINIETDPIRKAARFIFLSNFTYLGKGDTLLFITRQNSKKIVLEHLEGDYINMIADVQFMSSDFRDVFKNMQWLGEHKGNNKKVLVYADPPYLGCANIYRHSQGNLISWTESDFIDLLEMFQSKRDIRFAVSEFNHPFIIEQAIDRGLNIIEIGERRNLSGKAERKTEILITNYDYQKKLFD